MNLRNRLWGAIGGLAFLAGNAWAGSPTDAKAPAKSAASHNQKTAQNVALAIARAVPENGYEVNVETRSGVVTLKGVACSPTQIMQIVEAAKATVPGTQIVNNMTISDSNAVKQTGYGVKVEQDAGVGAQPLDAATPQHTMPQGATPQYDYPYMPPFAWPAAAPYPNYSAVQYPHCYPNQAWPAIGPYTPYPEPPLDWREVKLAWHNGHWFLRFKKPCPLTCRSPITIGCCEGGWEVRFKKPGRQSVYAD